jgi:hypothetical protein
VKALMDLGIPELTEEQIAAVSQAAEDAARKHIFSKISPKKVESLDITVEAEGTKPVSFTVEVDLKLKPEAGDVDSEALVKEAVKTAFDTVEKNLRNLKCPSTK